MKFNVRTNPNHPSKLTPGHCTKTFSLGVGPATPGYAAWYRVKGKSSRWREVDALAEKLRAWLEENAAVEGGERWPGALVTRSDGPSIILTERGREEGFQGMRRRKGSP